MAAHSEEVKRIFRTDRRMDSTFDRAREPLRAAPGSVLVSVDVRIESFGAEARVSSVESVVTSDLSNGQSTCGFADAST